MTAPANSNLAPPGDHLLFILNDKGVPPWHLDEGVWAGPDRRRRSRWPRSGSRRGLECDRGVDPGRGGHQTAFNNRTVENGRLATNGQATILQLMAKPTVYFRKKLRLTGAALGGKLKVQHDDGGGVADRLFLYFRNIETGADHARHMRRPSATQVSEATFPVGLLVEGTTGSAVRVKRVKLADGPAQSELRFDLELAVSVQA